MPTEPAERFDALLKAMATGEAPQKGKRPEKQQQAEGHKPVEKRE